ncbi:MAG: aminotransferase [Deltaproteobacteria bacterium]|nr:MAG: aminotransferase [Deltaproteobacteria bacterium]
MPARKEQLAIDGGTPVRTASFAAWPAFDAGDIEAVAGVLRSGRVNYWTGEEGSLFEREFAAFSGCRYAVAVANGTVALELALAALDIGPGDEVIVPCRTFIATASAVVRCGAVPVMADVDADSQLLTAAMVEPLITAKTRALMVVHLAGWPAEMDKLLALVRRYDLRLVEDCAQAHGATYQGRPVGSFGDVAAFSFCQDKIMTTGGEGGMLITNREDVFEKAWSLKDHGKDYRLVRQPVTALGFRWLHVCCGTNGRLTEMQAVLGRRALAKLPAWVEIRRRHAALLTAGFGRQPCLRLTIPPAGINHSYYKYYVFLRPERLRPGWNRDRFLAAVNAEGIPCFSGSCPEIYWEKALVQWQPSRRLPAARRLGETSLMFLVHPTLTEADMGDTVAAVDKVSRAAGVD